jgi:hypothetical protein
MKVKVFYDTDVDGSLFPKWAVVNFSVSGVPWESSTIYVDVMAPFERIIGEDFGDLIGCSVNIEDLLINLDKPNSFGINLKNILKRYKGYDLSEVEHLIIQISDIEDVMQMKVYRV